MLGFFSGVVLAVWYRNQGPQNLFMNGWRRMRMEKREKWRMGNGRWRQRDEGTKYN